MAILFDPWEVKAVPQDSMPSPDLPADIGNGDYVVHFENGKVSYKSSGGGSELPEVTADDNGDVLTVVSGEWAKATPSGGSGVLVCTPDNDGILDHTWQEINDAAENGIVILKQGRENDWSFCCISACYADSGDYGVYFIDLSSGELSGLSFIADSADGYPVIQQV